LFLRDLKALGKVLKLFSENRSPTSIAVQKKMHSRARVNRTLLMAALDDERFHWSPEPWFVCGTGNVLVIAGLAATGPSPRYENPQLVLCHPTSGWENG
jgi:hypothetical protein